MADLGGRIGVILGDYRLESLIEERPEVVVWLAEQQSVRRSVVLMELRPGLLDRREEFLADVRAMAAADQPVMASIYEAVSTEDQCFVAAERLAGATLASRVQSREALPAATLCHILARVAEVMVALDAAGTNVAPLTLQAIHFDPHAGVRLENLIRTGARSAARSSKDAAALGAALRPLVADGLPGASRLHTLLAWMRGEGLAAPLTWAQIRDYSQQIEQQLAEGPQPIAPASVASKKRGKSKGLVGGVILAIAASAAVYYSMKGSHPAPLPELPAPLAVSAGTHPTPDGSEEDLPAFEISGHEATIREYRDFLSALQRLPADQRASFDAPGQPASKAGHQPADWDPMLAAARSGGQWQGRPMSLECPVVNIDWWDAAAFCKWNSGRLPTQEEWFAALRIRLEDPSKLAPAEWGPVQEAPATDRTPAGLFGMAGSVAEWTQDPAINPANPLGGKHHVITGASFLRPGGGALAREWTDDLLQRRPDLGFRFASDGK